MRTWEVVAYLLIAIVLSVAAGIVAVALAGVGPLFAGAFLLLLMLFWGILTIMPKGK